GKGPGDRGEDGKEQDFISVLLRLSRYDFYCHKASLIVELDGPVHRENPEKDRERDLILKANGFRILRFWNEEVFDNIDSIVERISMS
ncbi:MAG: DUF559 domain-containing protein, partial [Anaerolineales bacterium]|nr:DUF559 domain-containing protein [Anaerolineales bacterium]